MRKEPIMTESKGQQCLLERICHVNSTGETHELKGLQPTRALHLGEVEGFWPSILYRICAWNTKNNHRICQIQNNSTAVFTDTESFRVCRVFYWNELVMSPVQVSVMSLKGLSHLGLLLLGRAEGIWPSILYRICAWNQKTIIDTQNNSTAVFTDAEPLRDFRLLWRLLQRCLRQTESEGPL